MGAAISFLVLLLVVLNLLLSKWLFGEKRNKVFETDGGTFHRWGMIILAFISIGVYIFIAVIGLADSNAVIWFWVIFFIVLFSYQSFIEWKYITESKQYVIPIILMVLGVICLCGIYFVDYQIKNPTFQEVISDQLNEDTTVREISIYIDNRSGDGIDKVAKTTIEDEAIINRILDDLSKMKLRQDDALNWERKYRLQVVVTNQVEEDHYSTESFYIELDENYIIIPDSYYNHFQIMGETDHLHTIKSLVENEDVEWEYIGE